MVFKKLLGALGVGGPSVDTVLDGGVVVPGSALTGRVLVLGGSRDAEITEVRLGFVARVEIESEEGESDGTVVFHRQAVGGAFQLTEGQEVAIPFTLDVPWETPVNEVYGRSIGVTLGVRTELAVAGALDPGDLDPLVVQPLPVQQAVLDAFARIGCGFKSADLELGRIGGTGQTLPFYQEIELTPPDRYAGSIQEIELTFLASPGGVEIVLEADKRGGLLGGGGDVLNRHVVSHDDAGRADWADQVDGWVRQLAERRGFF
ncbi:sporulation protein [Streptomyces marincola]|uniref:Sporulation protein n=1 Tax=Streptomyces marincola TaxID=2878388 RepID=A0A1W7D3S2_9ACTN|nr:sporulation protein [Streptomyces marincola]